jgi:hypothetical protein
MQRSQTESGQTMQRLKVGMTGLALVLVLIMLDSALSSTASTDKPVDVVGGPKAEVVANLSITNDSVAAGPAKGSEPLAELGVAPSAVDGNTAAPDNQTTAVPPPAATGAVADPAPPAQH